MRGAKWFTSPCPVEDRGAALKLLLRRLPEQLSTELIRVFIEDPKAAAIDFNGLWIARQQTGRIVGAIMTQCLAGKVAAVWAPEVALIWRRSEVAAALVAESLDSLRDRGYAIAQALIEKHAPKRESADLSRGGMPHVTDLIYLDRETNQSISIDPAAPRFRWQTYNDNNAYLFHKIVESSYEGSLDMPELMGIRTIDDIMTGHQAEGRFDPSRWRIGFLENEPKAAAVLLLSTLPERTAWEVAYLGLTPEARGRGLGRTVVAEANELAKPHASRLRLAVDSRNFPAIKLYERTGFVAFDRRAVHFAAL
jgi:ribosomal protein S18 acetylase RimI-like enzyme